LRLIRFGIAAGRVLPRVAWLRVGAVGVRIGRRTGLTGFDRPFCRVRAWLAQFEVGGSSIVCHVFSCSALRARLDWV
jgi:hypothetical protein